MPKHKIIVEAAVKESLGPHDYKIWKILDRGSSSTS